MPGESGGFTENSRKSEWNKDYSRDLRRKPPLLERWNVAEKAQF